ncbi:MAG: hypothetical protein PVG55_04630 [Nitrospirota bacterium]|jgi:hypothetical protein
MAKKRTAASQKYAEAQKRNQEKLDAGLVSERFPAVSGMIIKMTYFHESAQPVLMVRTVNVFPSSHAYFLMSCMDKDCEDGGFDLAPVVSAMVRGRKKASKGEMVCRGRGGKLSRKHAKISYDIKIRYRSK